jgi:hypothetical protein
MPKFEMDEKSMRLWMERNNVPEGHREILLRYVLHGTQMGHALTALVENDLFQFVSRADTETMQNMHLLVKFFYNAAPSPCWGSPTKVSMWIRQGGLNGTV